MPRYATDKGHSFTVLGVKSPECPVSLLTGSLSKWVERFARNKRMKESGAVMYGTSLHDWPAHAVDAFDCLEAETLRYDRAEREALERGNK